MADRASWPRRVWRNLYWWREDRATRRAFRGVKHAVYFGGNGIGDELLCTAPLHELRRRGADGLCALTNRPEIFQHSPDVDAIKLIDHSRVAFLPRAGIRASPTSYIREQRPPDIDVPPPRHIIAEMCRLCGISGPVELRPWLWLTEAERQAASEYRNCIVMQSSGRSASLAIANKEWLPERFQAVAAALQPTRRVIQIGSPNDPPLPGATDLRGRKSIRESAAILANAAAFVGLVGFPMHLARAVDCPAVIVYGGREHPSQSGYICNENLFTALPCSPCWRWNSCDFEHRCMTAITPEHVLSALEKLLQRPRLPLAVEQAVLP